MSNKHSDSASKHMVVWQCCARQAQREPLALAEAGACNRQKVSEFRTPAGKPR